MHILHQDDSVLPGFYGKYERVIENNANIALVASRSFWIDEQGIIKWITQRVVGLENGSRSVSGLYYSWPLQCPAVVVKRSAYEILGVFRKDLKYTLDNEMWTRIISQMGGIVLPDVLARYRESNTNESNRLWKSTEALADTQLVDDIFAARYHDFDRSKAKRTLWKRAMRVAESMAQQNDQETASAIRKYLRHNLPVSILLRCEISQILRRIAMLLGLNSSY